MSFFPKTKGNLSLLGTRQAQGQIMHNITHYGVQFIQKASIKHNQF